MTHRNQEEFKEMTKTGHQIITSKTCYLLNIWSTSSVYNDKYTFAQQKMRPLLCSCERAIQKESFGTDQCLASA